MKPGAANCWTRNCAGRQPSPTPMPSAIKMLSEFWPTLIGRTQTCCCFSVRCIFIKRNFDQSAHYYQEYLTHVPQDAAARQQLAQILSYAPGRLAEAAAEYENTAKITGDPQLQLQRAAVLLQLAQDASDDPRQHDQAPAKWSAASAALQQIPAAGLPPELLREQARLLLWLGELEPALDLLDKYLAQAPQDRQAHLDRARTLIYLQRGSEAAEVLRRLPPDKPSDAPDQVLSARQPYDQSLHQVSSCFSLSPQENNPSFRLFSEE